MLFKRTRVYKIKKYLQNFLFILCVLFFSKTLLATPATITFQARIVKPDLTNLESSSVSFKFYYLYPKPGGTDLQCVIYAEEITGVNMTGSKGLVTLQLGTGTRTYGSGNLKNVFDNSTASYTCQAGGTYSPSADDNRRVIVQFNDGTGIQTLPPSELTAVPYSMQSYNSQRLGNSLATDFLKFIDFTGSCLPGEYLKYDSTANPKFSCAIPIGTGAGIVMSVAPGTGPLLVGGTATDPTISIPKATVSTDGYLSSADFTTFNSKLSNFSTLTSSDISAKYGYVPASPSDSRFTDTRIPTDGSVTAAKIASATITFDKFNQSSATTGQVIKWNGSAWVASNDNTGAGAVTSVAGRTGVVTLSSSDISGLAFGTTAGTYAQGNDSRFTDTRTPTDNSVTSTKVLDGTIASADLSNASIEANKLAQMGATTGQVMKWNGSAWVASSDDTGAGGTVTSVSASGPLSSSGGGSPNITIAKATASVDGYLSSADFTTFAAKLSNFSTLLSSDITSKLGYTPVNPSALGTSAILNTNQVVLVSNLPSNCNAGQTLTFSSPTGSWVCSNIVLNSNTVTSAMISSLDWTKVVNTPTTAAGYGIPRATAIVDGYLSSADFTIFNSKLSDFSTLLSSDITGKLGYTPANETSAWSVNVSGDVSRTTSKVGIGTASPAYPLSVAGIVQSTSGGFRFPDGTTQMTAASGGLGANATINRAQVGGWGSASCPVGYTITGCWAYNGGGTVVNGVTNGTTTCTASGGATYWTDAICIQVAGTQTGGWSLSGLNTYYNDGNVGIGTASPSEMLTLSKTGANAALVVEQTNAGSGYNSAEVRIANYGGTTGGVGSYLTMYGSNGSKAAPTPLLSNEPVASIYARTRPNAGNDFISGSIEILASENHTISSTPGKILLKTTPSGGFSPLTRLSILADGKVGVGTSSPGYALEVSGDISVSGKFKVNGVDINSGTVTTVTASSPLISSGGATPNITLAKANGSTDGYLSSADWTTFNTKLSDFSSLVSSDITSN